MRGNRTLGLLLPAALLASLILSSPTRAEAFCGFYVSGASGEMYNDATQVVLMRDGTRTVLSMRNHYKGPPKDFALVVPVPQILAKENVKTLEDSVFTKVDQLAAPRLVEYWEQDPCVPTRGIAELGGTRGGGASFGGKAAGLGDRGGTTVKVEAQFDVDEYEIVILSAEESNGLERWLRANEYNIPKGAAKVLGPYIEQGMYFFVARVDASEVEFDKKGQTMLSPLQFHYDSEQFSLPVRLGLLNARGHQDLIVHILSKQGRYEVANYPNAFIPTNLVVSQKTKKRFAQFYTALFDYTLKENPGAVVTEYSWSAGKCDPCPTPPLGYNALVALGADVADPSLSMKFKGRVGLHAEIKVQGNLDPRIAHRIFRRHQNELNACYDKALHQHKGPAPTGGEGEVKLQLTSTGAVMGIKLEGDPLQRSAQLRNCVRAKMLLWVFPKPRPGSATTEVLIPLRFDVRIRGRGARAVRGWTLTRLHARYTAKQLGEELIFQTSPSIIGGVGMPRGEEGRLPNEGVQIRRHGDQFQGRYVILNRWNEELTCSEPRRGVWGGPPGEEERVHTAQETAFVRRGRYKLSKKQRAQVGELSRLPEENEPE